MMEHDQLQNGLSTLDYGVFFSVLVISFVIGIYNGFKSKNTEEDFFMAGRTYGFFPVGLSVIISFISAIAILGMTAEAYADGFQLFTYHVGSFFGTLAAAFTMTPVYFNLKIVSINEYLEYRFESKLLREVALIITLIGKIFYMGIALYAPTVVLSTVTALDYTTYIFILSVVCTIYCSFGGMRAVIWTDVFQALITVFGMGAIITMAFIKAGTAHQFWTIAIDGGRLNFLNMSLSIYERHTFFNCFAMGFFFSHNQFGNAQEVVQRICSVKNLKEAKRAMCFAALGNLIAYTALQLGGAAIYVYYHGCDPLTLGVIEKKDQILPLFIMQATSVIYGFPGLFVGIIFAATLSTISSLLNSCVALLWKDAFQQVDYFNTMKPRNSQLMNKFLTVIFGILMVGMAFVFSQGSSGLTQVVQTFSGALSGAFYGVFLLALFFPKCGSRGAIVGLIVSWGFITWMSFGSYYCVSSSHATLPLSAEKCINSSFSIGNDTLEVDNDTPLPKHCKIFLPFYKISYTLYVVFGFIVSILLGLMVTYLIDRPKEVVTAKKFVSPLIWRYYWKEK